MTSLHPTILRKSVCPPENSKAPDNRRKEEVILRLERNYSDPIPPRPPITAEPTEEMELISAANKTKVMFRFWAAELITDWAVSSFSTASATPKNHTGKFVRAAEFESNATARLGSSTQPKNKKSGHDGSGIGDEGLRGGAGGPEPDNAMADGDDGATQVERRQRRLRDSDAARGVGTAAGRWHS